MTTEGERSAGMQNGQRGNARMHEMNTYANAMHMMTWYEMHENEKQHTETKTRTREINIT